MHSHRSHRGPIFLKLLFCRVKQPPLPKFWCNSSSALQRKEKQRKTSDVHAPCTVTAATANTKELWQESQKNCCVRWHREYRSLHVTWMMGGRKAKFRRDLTPPHHHNLLHSSFLIPTHLSIDPLLTIITNWPPPWVFMSSERSSWLLQFPKWLPLPT